jgi:hypothetical protein
MIREKIAFHCKAFRLSFGLSPGNRRGSGKGAYEFTCRLTLPGPFAVEPAGVTATVGPVLRKTFLLLTAEESNVVQLDGLAMPLDKNRRGHRVNNRPSLVPHAESSTWHYATGGGSNSRHEILVIHTPNRSPLPQGERENVQARTPATRWAAR